MQLDRQAEHIEAGAQVGARCGHAYVEHRGSGIGDRELGTNVSGLWAHASGPRPSSNSLWMLRTALSSSSLESTNERFNSEEPWAMASTSMASLPMRVNTRPATSGLPRMPEPITATMDTPFRRFMPSIRPWSISVAKARSSAVEALRPNFSSITRQILYSDDDCEIISTLMFSWATVEKSRAATPGRPIIPLPCTVSSVSFEIAVMALTGPAPLALSAT